MSLRLPFEHQEPGLSRLGTPAASFIDNYADSTRTVLKGDRTGLEDGTIVTYHRAAAPGWEQPEDTITMPLAEFKFALMHKRDHVPDLQAARANYAQALASLAAAVTAKTPKEYDHMIEAYSYGSFSRISLGTSLSAGADPVRLTAEGVKEAVRKLRESRGDVDELRPVMTTHDPLGQFTFEAFGPVLRALELVRQDCPGCVDVVYGDDVQPHWCYRDAQGKACVFPSPLWTTKAQDIMEDARSAVHNAKIPLPVTFVMPQEPRKLPGTEVIHGSVPAQPVFRDGCYRTTTGRIARIDGWSPTCMVSNVPSPKVPSGFVRAWMKNKHGGNQRVEWCATTGKLWNGLTEFGNLTREEVTD